MFTAGTLVILAIVYIIIMFAVLLPQSEDMSEERIAAHELQGEIERLWGLSTLPDSDYHYAVFDLSGHNLGSTLPSYKNDINIRLLSTAKEYTAPLIVNGTQVGVLIVDIPSPPMWKASLWLSLPAIVLCAALLVLLARQAWFVRSDIIRPLDELHGVVEQMVKGDLSVSVSYDYDGEIGTFCHDFEAMRDELRDAAEREKAYQEKERLLFASLSHDLKTPLSSISGYAESVRYGVVKDPADIERYMDTILSKVKSLTASIEDILTHVQTQMRQMSMEKEGIYSGPFFTKLFADAAQDAYAKGRTLVIEGEIPNRLITLDPARITQVVQNIVGNSLKYTQPGGIITVSVGLDQKAMILSIEDTDCGIKPEDVPFVFEPFFRGDKARNPNISGSGLGLSIAKYIVEQHGGMITCESVLGEGTRVALSIAL